MVQKHFQDDYILIETKKTIEEYCPKYKIEEVFIKKQHNHSNDYLQKNIIENINIQKSLVDLKNEYNEDNTLSIYPSHKFSVNEEIKIYLNLFGSVFFTKYNGQLSSIYSNCNEKVWTLFLDLYDKNILNVDVIKYFDYNKNYKNKFKNNVSYKFISNKKTSIDICNNKLFSLFINQKKDNINAGICSFLTTRSISDLIIDNNIISLQQYVHDIFFMPDEKLKKTLVYWKIILFL